MVSHISGLNYSQFYTRTKKERKTFTMTSHKTSNVVGSVFVEPNGNERIITGVGQPELMIFEDQAGEKYRIFMDIGTHERAYQLFMDENWEELKKFPKYSTQFLHS